MKRHAETGTDPSDARTGERLVYFREAAMSIPCPIYDRDGLRTGNRIQGPAIVEQMDTTTVLLPGQFASVDPYLNLIVEVN